MDTFSTYSASSTHKHKDPWVRTFEVSKSIFHNKGFTLYKVISKVFPRNSVEAVTEVTVWKRYNDFKKLHKALNTIHQNLYLKGTFPPFAKTRIFGRFDPEVIEERRRSALELLQFSATYPALFTSQVFVKFFEDGYIVEEAQKPLSESKLLEPDLNNILKPQRIIQQCNSQVAKAVSPKNENNRLCLDGTETATSLGGIWQHHQLSDTISLTSQDDDDDDRTTFTDDDSQHSSMKTSLNLAEFDPLLLPDKESKDETGNICDNWLLSALKSVSDGSALDRDPDVLEFPKPFGDFDSFEETITPMSVKNEEVLETQQESHFTFDIPSRQETPDITEFDPLTIQPTPHDETDSIVVDDSFAMTPNAYKKESGRQPPSYVLAASKHVKFAQESEEEGRYQDAYDLYKKAIDVLLQGFQKDKCDELKSMVKKRVLLYLMKAEELYENKLQHSNGLKSKCNISLAHLSSMKTRSLQGSIQELEKYKVLGILDKVLLVIDTSTNDTFIVKSVYKSTTNPSNRPPHRNNPFMVKLFKTYETQYAYFLILEHATGGRLWDYVSSFLQRHHPLTNEETVCVRTKTESSGNIYAGKKMVEEEEASESQVSVDSDLTPSKTCPPSYVALFKKYANSMEKEDNVSFAKYRRADGKSGVAASETLGEVKRKLHCLQPPPASIRNRLSSSTGSLEKTFQVKTCNLDALKAMDGVAHETASTTVLPEECICLWAAEIVLALEHLHSKDVIWMDLNPDNILLGAEGHILLTYKDNLTACGSVLKNQAKSSLFCAPEVGSIFPVDLECDWWSLGAILFELTTGQPLVAYHPTGITQHTVLNFPNAVSSDAKDLILKLLQFNPKERLGSGIFGTEEIKSHPFFRNVDWKCLQS